MSVLQDYAPIRELLESAVENALRDNVADGLKKKIQQKALEKVYSYVTASKRRKEDGGLIDDVTILTSVDGMTLTLEKASEPQHKDGIDLTPIVEEGWGNWHQPYPRPFMDAARDEYVDSREAGEEIAKALRAVGFTC